ncbi:MAG: glycosyltransferase [Chromatiaceae bacterium]|nr:glycosyltransferase [Chromatiaceae bacterium]
MALALYQRRDLETAALLVATAEQEAENLRRFGLRQPIAIIPNGVDLLGGKVASTSEAAARKSLRYALFLSRVHPKKGLENLLRAWAKTQPQDWILQIAGPDEGGHLAQVLALAKRLGISHQVQYLGEFDDRAKWAVYRDADLFVLPTFSENFGVVVAEALSQGLPVITTTGTPWEDLRTYGCGWWVEPSEAGLQQALVKAFGLPAGRLAEMGERGRDYVQRYDWPVIAGQMLDAYRWVLGVDDKPDYVYLE